MTLTRDEILAMEPGTELNGLIASAVMGWHIVEGHMTGRLFWHDATGVSHGVIYDFKPSTDISSAFEVVEKMRTTHKQYITIIDNPHLNYDVRFSGSISKEYHRLSNLPHAICRAALLAVMDV